MQKEEFFRKCEAAGLTGTTFDYDTLLMWIPEKDWFVRIMCDTSGEQLIAEDAEEGFTDYVDYKINEFTDCGDILFDEGDGGIFLFNNEESCGIKEIMWGMLNEMFSNEKIPDIIWLSR